MYFDSVFYFFVVFVIFVYGNCILAIAYELYLQLSHCLLEWKEILLLKLRILQVWETKPLTLLLEACVFLVNIIDKITMKTNFSLV